MRARKQKFCNKNQKEFKRNLENCYSFLYYLVSQLWDESGFTPERVEHAYYRTY